MSDDPSAINPSTITGTQGGITAGLFSDATIRRMADTALNARQRDYLDALAEPVRGLAWSRVRDAMHTAARLQVEFCCQVGISQTALERLVLDVQAEVERRELDAQLARLLVQAGANFMVVRSFLPNFNKPEFSRLRQELGLVGQQPARKAVGEEESVRIYRQWQALGKPDSADGLLALHRESGQPLSVLWGLVQDWQYQITTKGKG
jgi:hypothetical protein